MLYRIVHTTRYAYSEQATLGHNQARLVPRSFARQQCRRAVLEISPHPAVERAWIDSFGNSATYFTIETPHRELTVTARSEVEVFGGCELPREFVLPWEAAAAHMANFSDAAGTEAAAFVYESPSVHLSEEVRRYAEPSFPPGRWLTEVVLDLTRRIHIDFRYDPTATTVNTPTHEFMQRRRGVCQDFAHLQIACLRSLGLAARYVSGYLVTRPPPGKPRLVGADASHAWVSVFFPGVGWIDFDPTNNQLTTHEYITLAWGRDYSDVCPIKGVFLGGGAHSMGVAVDVLADGECISI